MRARAELALAAVTILWGSTFVMVKAALADVSPILFIGLRFSLAAVTLALIYGRKVRRNALGGGLLAGSLLFAAFVCQTMGLALTTPSKSAFLTSLSIPMVPLAGSLVYRSRPKLAEVAGILVSSVGMILLTLPANPLGAGGFGVALRLTTGDWLSFFCAVLFAVHIVVTGHYSPIGGFESLAVIQAAVAAVLGLSIFRFAEPVRFHLTLGVGAAVVVTGLLTTALAFTTMAWAQQYTSATRAALIFTVEPVVAWLTSWILTGEALANRGKVGAGLILAGIVLGELTRTQPHPARAETIGGRRTS
ncbi:MAG TPA: DMT family transporter [Bryobacteraceae bacterium]|nr:DMT family transporter [Bryobacteraceae bacterium]